MDKDSPQLAQVKIGDICIIEYRDASCTYQEIDNLPLPEPSISIGKLKRLTPELIDISFVWSENQEGTTHYDSIVMPLSTVLDIRPLTKKV